MLKAMTLILLLMDVAHSEVRIDTEEKILNSGRDLTRSVRDFLSVRNTSNVFTRKGIQSLSNTNSTIVDSQGREFIIIEADIVKEIVIDRESMQENEDF